MNIMRTGQGLSNAFFCVFLLIIVYEITARLPKNITAFCKMWPSLTPGDLNIHPSEKWSERLRKPLLGAFEAALRTFLALCFFLVNQGGHFDIHTMAKSAETPTLARVQRQKYNPDSGKRWILFGHCCSLGHYLLLGSFNPIFGIRWWKPLETRFHKVLV